MATPTVEPAPSETKTQAAAVEKRTSVAYALHYRLALTLYRVFAIVVLYLVLAGVLGSFVGVASAASSSLRWTRKASISGKNW